MKLIEWIESLFGYGEDDIIDDRECGPLMNYIIPDKNLERGTSSCKRGIDMKEQSRPDRCGENKQTK